MRMLPPPHASDLIVAADGLRTIGLAFLICASTARTPLIGGVYHCGPIA